MKEQGASIARDLMPAAPPAAVGGMTFFGIPLPELVLIATLIYTVAQLIVVAPKVWAVVRQWFKRDGP